MYQITKNALSFAAFFASFSVVAQQADLQSTQDVRAGNEYQQNTTGAINTPRISNQLGKNSAFNSTDVTDTTFSDGKGGEPAAVLLKNKKQEKSEFQNFVEYATGKQLPIYGEDFFSRPPSSFAPLQNTPVPSDYVLGAGDEVLIRAWGSVDVDYRATVDRNGLINIPTIGTITMAGVKAGDADTVIKSSIAKLYRDVAVSVTFGRLRAMTVYVVGQAKKPGSYTVSGYSTLVTALLASGGPNLTGSMRNVQVKRHGKVAGSLDLYAFIAKGDKSNDVKLQDGDTIYIPPAAGYVALTGKVNTPAIYELKPGNESVASILDVAGGIPVVADPRRAFLERIDPAKSQPRSVEEFALNHTGLSKVLKNGDLLTVTSISPDFSNAVTLRGNVNQPLRMPYKTDMRIRDLIPNREALITRASIQRQNDVLLQKDDGVQEERNGKNVFGDTKKQIRENADSISSSIGNLIDNLNWDYAVVERLDRATLNVSLLPFNLGRAMDNPDSEDNLRLQPGDAVTVFSQNDIQVPISKRKVFARIEGEVNAPGVYQMGPGETIQSLIAKAGGTTTNAYFFGTEFYREKVRQEQQVNLEKAVRRLESQIRTETAKAAANQSSAVEAQAAALKLKAEQDASNQVLNRMRELKATGRISFGLAANDDSYEKIPALKLENGDRLVIPSRPDFVHVFGAVNQEASIIWHKGMTVDKYLTDAGPTSEADMESVFVLRANGTVVSAVSRGWFSSINSVEVMPGDSIVVPERLNKETAYKTLTNGLKDWAQILSGFGLSAAAIKSLRQ